MSYQVNALKTALYGALSSDPTLGAMLSGTAAVYDTRPPQGATLPYVIFQRLASTPAHTLTGRAWDDHVYLVKAVTQSDSAAAGGSIAERVNAILEDNPLTVSGATTMYLRRIGDVDYPEVDNGKPYHHVGSQYRVWTS